MVSFRPSATTTVVVVAWDRDKAAFCDQCLLIPSMEVGQIAAVTRGHLRFAFNPHPDHAGKLDPLPTAAGRARPHYGGTDPIANPSGVVATMSPSGVMPRCQPSSCTLRWWRRHSSTRLSITCLPPSAQCWRWCASVQSGGLSHPGNLQPLSLTTRALRCDPLIERLVCPACGWSDSEPTNTGVIAASQASRRAVSAGIGCAHSSSAAGEPG